MASVYRSCDDILKLSLVESMFGPPLEMFHCGGTAIVYNVTGHDEYIVHGRNALVAEPQRGGRRSVHSTAQGFSSIPGLDGLRQA
jgi:hypothetical protein